MLAPILPDNSPAVPHTRIHAGNGRRGQRVATFNYELCQALFATPWPLAPLPPSCRLTAADLNALLERTSPPIGPLTRKGEMAFDLRKLAQLSESKQTRG